MTQELPHLSFIAVDKLIHHERHDDERTYPLIQRIQSSGVFRNPPIVMPLQDSSGRYMILDGANRCTAIQAMGFPHILVQVVEPDDPGLELKTWNHAVWGLRTKSFLEGLHSIPALQLADQPDRNFIPDLFSDCGMALVILHNGKRYVVCQPVGGLKDCVSMLNSIVDSYQERARFDRTNLHRLNPIKERYPHLTSLVVFPPFNVRQLLRLAGDGCLLPSGITRLTISPRVLHLNYPLEELAVDHSLEAKNERLESWIRERLDQRQVRYYAEATYLFDD